MAVYAVYQELQRPDPRPGFSRRALQLLEGLEAAYGSEAFGPYGVGGALARLGPALQRALAPACESALPGYGLERIAATALDRAMGRLPGPAPDVYLGTLFFVAPAATVGVNGEPVIALGLERFHPTAPAPRPRRVFAPADAEEMVPHEAAHVVRLRALQLEPSPRRLSLLEMVMLEGTALLFTDLLLGRKSLLSFLPADRFAWHEANEAAVAAAAAREFNAAGMAVFSRYFAPDAPVSGYYVGYSLCREYLRREGDGAIAPLLTMPSREILTRLGWSVG